MAYNECEVQKQLMRINRIILQRAGDLGVIRSRYVPRWYRGLSDYQVSAANALSAALRDDIEQRTLYRVTRVIVRMGLNPKPTKPNLRLVMRMSRGNDIAFLWFLMEVCYKTKLHGRAYSANEQIIMSSIFRLDLHPTLRELDRVLPLPHASARERAKQSKAKTAAKEKRIAEQIERKRRAAANSKISLPYFEELREPQVHSSRLTANYPTRPALIKIFNVEKDNPGLWSRWFGSFDVNESHCVTKPLLYKEIKRIITSFTAARLHADDVESMCATHKKIGEVEESLKRNLEAIKVMERQKWADLTTEAQKRRRKRVLEDLENMTAKFEKQFHNLAIKTRMSTTCKQLYVGCKGLHPELDACRKPDFVFVNESFATEEPDRRLCGGSDLSRPTCLEWDMGSCAARQLDGSKSSTVKLLQGQQPVMKSVSCNEEARSRMFCDMYDPNKELPKLHGQRKLSVEHFLRLRHIETQRKSATNSDTNKYFELGSSTHDYKFNYRKLFDTDKLRKDNDELLRLKLSFIEAIDSDVEFLNKAFSGGGDKAIDAAVDHVAKKLFREDSDLYRREYDRIVQYHQQSKIRNDTRLDFGREYYDAEDIVLMKEMLRLGLERVSEDKRYVLPTLPQVHCVPFLIEWISYRYGKRYSQKERERIFKNTKYLMRQLTRLLQGILMPRAPEATMTMRSFSLQPQLRRLAQRIHYSYRDLFCRSIMEVGRMFYFAMRPQLCHRMPVNTFYAYMPAHFRDTNFSVTTMTRNPNLARYRRSF
ncbi:uncharacterized protein LOC115621456 [Scaptodrosophila lebanonensis]|uniref:Uncharacterized protein LOC115621456 n=1 Tax=Drosophila lebanonensis TaxID=7225 RepID=A0A6J2T7Q1_DROLE|nr:uncharacterized protein LOC115621456 [Scaptodrosophila lebanonensis]